MTARILCLTLALLFLALAPLAAAKPPEFRGIVFGSALADNPGLTHVGDAGPVAFYRRDTEKPVFGEECATEVRYGFSRGLFFFARMTLAGCQGLGALVQAFEAKYGLPAREGAPGFVRLVWRLPTLTVSLSHFAREGTTEVDYVFLPNLAHEERETWQSAEDVRARGPIGFRGLRFGREIASLPGLTLAYKEGVAEYYRRAGERLELGETRLSDILYGFYEGKFFAVLMRADTAADFDALRQAYAAKYGAPRAIPATLEEELVWSWPTAQIALSRDTAAGGLAIRYADAGLLAKVVAAEAASGRPPSLSGGLRIFSKGDPPRSFRGAAFGSPESSLPGGEYLFGHRGRRYFRRADERLVLGDIPLLAVLYAYDGGKLSGVALTVAPSGNDAQGDYARVLDAYTAKYGPPADRPGEDGSRLHLWSWPGLSLALIRPAQGPLEVHYIDASLLRRREGSLAERALDVLDQKTFTPPDSGGSRIERTNGQE
ncbi:hypothetical protein GTA51_11345 [Desulfovibrio aerotolerans]|uniref:Uncharacterized protein n=1 Tax=Solidesulfovibrio aerotolerans TaxID=295255 RepID=A0A7C9ILA0_9BACT|nr:hypothetical protein [Solidesulfovibrio aerotolerans]MYL83721.1 hypothetical protein [Solidesulfovibrio aerotolerans]